MADSEDDTATKNWSFDLKSIDASFHRWKAHIYENKLAYGLVTFGLVQILFLGIYWFPSEGLDDRTTQLLNFDLRKNMHLVEFQTKLGEPDAYDDFWNETPSAVSACGVCSSNVYSQRHRFHVETLSYGPFGVYRQGVGHRTDYYLVLHLVDGRLSTWKKSRPLHDE